MSIPTQFAAPTELSRAARLDRALADLLAQAPELQAAAVVSFDGLPMASSLPSGMDEDRVAAMSAALLSLGDKAAQGLGRGELSQVYIEGENGTVFLISAQDEAVLVAVAAVGAKAGLMLYEVRRAAAVVGAVLGDEGEQADPAQPQDQELAAAPEPVEPPVAAAAEPELPVAAAAEPELPVAADTEPDLPVAPAAAADQPSGGHTEADRRSPMYLPDGRTGSPVHEVVAPPRLVPEPVTAPAWSPYADQPVQQF
jgi:predicted regulator of Ras-like GTPase activity (Roadblock/LC7/MglB family)